MNLSQTFLAVLLLLSVVNAALCVELPRAGINLAFVTDYSASIPLTNYAKMSREWELGPADQRFVRFRDDVGKPKLAEVDDFGFPVNVEPGQAAKSFLFQSNKGFPTGKYVLTWEGEGDVRLSGSSITDVQSTTNRYEYDVPEVRGDNFELIITENIAADPIRNIQLRLEPTPESEGVWTSSAGSTFRPGYTDDLEGYGVLRFVDWNRTNSHTNADWNQRTEPEDSVWTRVGFGVPYETQIELSNRMSADMWLNIPHQASDEYVTQLAQLVDEQLSPDLRVWVEYTNEAWNSIFPQFGYMRTLADELGVSANSDFEERVLAYGRRSAEVFGLFEDVIGEESERMLRVVAGQGVNSWVMQTALRGATVDGEVQADVAAIAPYFGFTTQEIRAFYDELQANGAIDFDNAQAQLSGRIAEAKVKWQENHDVAEANGLPLVSYEAGQHITTWLPSLGRHDEPLIEAFAEFNRDDRMGELYEELIDVWNEAGGDTMIFYNNTQGWAHSGYWGLKESFDDPGNAKFQVVRDYVLSSPVTDPVTDIDRNGTFEAADIDLLIRSIGENANDHSLDFNSDDTLDEGDLPALLDQESILLGDTDLNGFVEFADFLILSSNFGNVGGWSDGNFDFDGTVGFADFLALSENFGGTSLVAVPEPEFRCLLLAVCCSLGLQRRRRSDVMPVR